MKKTFILAGFTLILLACKNKADENGADVDTLNPTTKHPATASTKNQEDMKNIKETVDEMMHGMHSFKPTGNNDVDFARMMIEHHRGAVAMARVEVENGNDTALRAFAHKVIADQNKEIDFMNEFVVKATKTASQNSVAFQKALNESMIAMMGNNSTVYNEVDKDFAARLIPHHQSVGDMAKGHLSYGADKELRKLCEE